MNRRLASALLGVAVASVAFAQSGTNSPYSQYGMGQLSEQSSGFNRGMNGLGLGFRESNQVNYINPASYSSMDSLTFIFDMGLSGQITNFSENGIRRNARNSDFEYAVAGFRAARHVGVSFGVVPFSNVGYSYSAAGYVDDTRTTTYTNTYSGSGGVHQVYLGAGAELFKGFSIGANISYLWGTTTRTISNEYSDTYVNSLTKTYSTEVSNYKLDFGVQYTQQVGKKDVVTLGATYGYGHKLGADPECSVTSTNSQTGVSNTTTYTLNNGLELPNMFGVGFSWIHDNRLKLGADYTLQQWGSVGFPVYTVVNDQPQYKLDNSYFDDRHKLTVGGEFCRNAVSRRFLDRVRFRMGASYASSYLNINGKDGPKEISVSAGFGIPLMNVWNNRSMLNISGQWVQQSATGLIRENTFRINIGMTFNERWFAKWKVE